MAGLLAFCFMFIHVEYEPGSTRRISLITLGPRPDGPWNVPRYNLTCWRQLPSLRKQLVRPLKGEIQNLLRIECQSVWVKREFISFWMLGFQNFNSTMNFIQGSVLSSSPKQHHRTCYQYKGRMVCLYFDPNSFELFLKITYFNLPENHSLELKMGRG